MQHQIPNVCCRYYRFMIESFVISVDWVGPDLVNHSLALPEAYKIPGAKYLFNLDIHGLKGQLTKAVTRNIERTIGE